MNYPGFKKVTISLSGFIEALLIEPINISFYASDAFVYYSGGIYYPSANECPTNSMTKQTLNHAMQAVGFGI